MSSSWRFIVFLHLFLVQLVHCTLFNRTIDDQFGDEVTGLTPRYFPPASWRQGATCPDCPVKLDPTQAYNQTWHDSRQPPGDDRERSITLLFNGTAVYVYCIITNVIPGVLTNLTFNLDGNHVGGYVQSPPLTSDAERYEYNTLVYSNTSMPNGRHSLCLEAVGASNPLFDYMIYTYDDTPVFFRATAPPKKRKNIVAIIGAAVGGFLFISLFLVFMGVRYRRRKLQRMRLESFISPFSPNPASRGSPTASTASQSSSNGVHDRPTYFQTKIQEMERMVAQLRVAGEVGHSGNRVYEVTRESADAEMGVMRSEKSPVPEVLPPTYREAARPLELSLIRAQIPGDGVREKGHDI